MNDKTDNIQQPFDDAIEELLAGELDGPSAETLKQAATTDQELALAIVDAWTLRKSLDELELELVPPALEKRLLDIPNKQQTANKWSNWFKFSNWQTGSGWAVSSALAMSLILAIGVSRQPDQSEIIQARQDIQLALTYLGKSLNQADQLTRDELNMQVHKILTTRPDKRNTRADVAIQAEPEHIDQL